MSDSHVQRHEAMVAQWGQPEPVSALEALRLLGLPYQQHVIAYRYASAEAARAFTASNQEHTPGFLSLGIAETEQGVIGAFTVAWPGGRTR